MIQEQAVTEEDKFFKFIASSTVDFTLAAKLADLEANLQKQKRKQLEAR